MRMKASSAGAPLLLPKIATDISIMSMSKTVSPLRLAAALV
jgi:hypothetical protein